MAEEIKKFLDQKGVEYLWSKINMQDYPNNDTLVAIINAIDEGKMDKTTAIPLIEQAIAGQVPVVKSVDENGKPVEWEAKEFTSELSFKIISYPDYGILMSEKTFKEVDDFARKNGLNNLNLSLFIAGTTLYDEVEGKNPYYYAVSCDKIYGITEEKTIAYDFTFIIGQEKRVYRLNESGVSVISSSEDISAPSVATVGQPLVVKEVDENGKPIEWETKEFPDHIRTIEIDDNSVYPGGAANILIYDREKIFSATDLVNLFRTFSMNELPYVFRQVAQPQEEGTTKLPKFMLKKTWTESIEGGYLLHLHFDDSLADILANSADNTISLDPDWVAPTTPSDIPDTTSAKQYLVTNNKGEKVWTNLPVTETIRIDLTDATRIMPDVIQNYSALTPAEIIQKGRSLVIYNLVFYREIRDHVGNQMGVVVDLVKDRGYKAFTNENGDYCLRIYFDNYAPIIVDATKENPFYLDPDYVAPEPIIPETTEPHQYLTTSENGEKVWEEKLAYYTWEDREVVPTHIVPENHNIMLSALFEIEDGTQCRIIYEGQNYTGICSNPKNGMYFNINMTEGEGFPVSKLWISIPPFTLSGPLVGFSGTIQVFANIKVPKPIKQEFLGVPVATGEGYNSLVAGNIAVAKATGQNSIALVFGEANGVGSVAINSGIVTDTGTGSFAQGSSTASGIYATALGIGTVAAGRAQLTHGENNIEDTENKYLHIVGNGTSGYDENNQYFKTHSNAYTLDRDGNAWFQGTIKIGGTGQDDEVAIEVATKPDVATLQSAIDTLNGTGEGSIRDTVADAVATIVANAPEDFDTLKEVADWISNDTLGTADLLQRMTTAEEKIVALDVQADWNQTDESAKDFIKNKPNENDALALLAETGFIDPVSAADGSVFTDSNGVLYTL